MVTSPATPNVSQAPASSAGTFIFPGERTITDAQGNTWGINANEQVVMNGTVDPNTAGVIEMAFDGTHVWQENNHDLWWSWQPSAPGNYAGWYPSSGTTTVPIPFTPSGSGTENSFLILDNSHNFWGIQNGKVTVNDVVDNTTAGVIQLAFENGRVYQENDAGLWWSKATPSDTWTPGPGSPTDPVTSATTFGTMNGWVGGHRGNSATGPANWSAGTVPSPGQTLYMIRGGTMNLSGGNLAGDTLLFNAQSQDNSNSPTVNLSKGAALTAGTSMQGSASPTINVSDTDTLDLVGTYPSGLDATVNLSALSHLITTNNVVFGSLMVNGSSGSDLTMAGTSNFGGTTVLLNTPQVDGTGTVSLDSAQSAPGRMEITGAVGNTVSFNLAGDTGRGTASGLTVDQPAEFHGSLNLAWSYVDLKGLTADSYDFTGGMLTLFENNTAVASFNVATQSVDNAPTSLVVEQGAGGVMLSVSGQPGGSDVYQPGGVGTVLPIHASV